jgi:hypothetical protein
MTFVVLRVFHWRLGNWKKVSSSSPTSCRLRTTPGQRGVHRLARRLEVEKDAVAFEVFHVTAVGEGLGHQPHEPLNAGQDGFGRVTGENARGACDVDEGGGESNARREPAFTQVALGEAG